MEEFEDDSMPADDSSRPSCPDDKNTMKNIGMDEVTPEGLTYHVNTIELEVERFILAGPLLYGNILIHLSPHLGFLKLIVGIHSTVLRQVTLLKRTSLKK